MSCAETLVKHFGDKDETCRALDINPETLRLWLRDGIPLGKALYVEQKSEGAVRAEEVVSEARAAA